jgi:hypothetical protein
MKMTVAFDPIGHQLLTGLKGEDRLVFGPMILKNSPDFFKKRDGPQVNQEDHQSNDSIHKIEEDPARGNHRDGEPQPFCQEEWDQKE